MNNEEFLAMYAARFRAMTAQDGIPEWMPLVNDTSADAMRDALDTIADHHRRLTEHGGRTIGAPRLGEVKAALEKVAAPPATYIPPPRPVTAEQSAEWARALETLKNTEVKP
jgi:hypothetical protein